MVGVHVRNVFDAPRDAVTAHETLGDAATSAAVEQYGSEAAEQLRWYRTASHWSAFVPRMLELLRSDARTDDELAQVDRLAEEAARHSSAAADGLAALAPGAASSTSTTCNP